MLTARAKRSVFGGFPTRGCLFLIVTLLSGETLGNGVSEKIRASAGGTVVLPCHISHSSNIPTVEWSKEGLDPNIAFLYRQGCETFEMKNPVFEFRTNLIMNKVKNGDISLHMSNVQLSDAGIYQCRVIWERNPEVLKTLELIVVAVSVPNLSFIPNAGSGVTLQCETNCWSPAPQITFLDNQGNNISAEDARRDQDSTGCFRVTKRVTVLAATERVTCRVHQPQINETRDTEIYIPADCMRSCTVNIIIAVAVAVAVTFLCGVFLGKFPSKCYSCVMRKKLPVSTESSDQSTTNRNAEGNHQSYEADSAQNVTNEHLRKIEELESNLGEKEGRIRQLEGELNHLRSSGMVLPCSTTSLQLPHEHQARQISALSPTVQRSSQYHSSPVLVRSDDTVLPAPSSASTSETKPLVRSKSVSESRPHSNGAKIQRRYTVSSNRFAVLSDLPEDSELLLQNEQK